MFSRRPAFAVRHHLLAGGCVLVLACGAALAGDDPVASLDFSAAKTPTSKTERPEPPRTAIVRVQTARFLSGVNMQMEALSTFEQTSRPGSAVQDNLMYAEYSLAVQQSLVRTTRRAFRDYLMQVTAVDQLIERYKTKGMQSVGLDNLVGTRSTRGSRFGFDFGFSHFRPEVGLEYEVGGSAFKLSVDGKGRAGFRYRNPKWGGNQVSLGFDGEDVYYVTWHVGAF